MNNAANDAPTAVMSVFLLLFTQEISVQSPGLSPTFSKSDPLFDLFNKSDGTEPVSLFFSRFLHRCYQELEPIFINLICYVSITYKTLKNLSFDSNSGMSPVKSLFDKSLQIKKNIN